MTAFAGLSIAEGATPNGGAAASGYDERNLIGSIHTSRGIVLLSMMGRTQEAVMALHEAVRVLGGDAGGGGIAGTLLSRAMEIWALEESQVEDHEDGESQNKPGRSRNTNINTRSRRKGVREHGRLESQESDAMNATSNEKQVERQLDDDADEILGAALRSVR